MVLRTARLIFWDFDGVIKESVDVKTNAYCRLFEPFGQEVVERVRVHHEAYGGMSRFDKIPLYLRWAGQDPSDTKIREFCDQFSRQVVQGVIDASWVPGVERYLRANTYGQTFILVSATPHDELHYILEKLDLKRCFSEVHGAPEKKKDVIRNVISACCLDVRHCLMIGDATADQQAADFNNVPFLLRKHNSNAHLFPAGTCCSIDDFIDL